MATFHTEDLNEPIPPVSGMLDAPDSMDVPHKIEFKKEQVRLHRMREEEHKLQVKRRETRGSEASRFLYVVVRTAGDSIVCSCEGKQQAEYIAMLLNDRPA